MRRSPDRRDQPDRACKHAVLHARAYRVRFGANSTRLSFAEAPFDELPRGAAKLASGPGCRHHHHEALAVAFGGPEEAEASLVGTRRS